MTLADQLKAASKDTLGEIVREAESCLNAQLTAAIAADQRALSFAGLLAVAAVLTAGAGGSLLIGEPVNALLGWVAISVTGALLIAMLCAIWSARPVTFQFPGNDPAGWIDDIGGGKSLHDSMAEMAAHYSGMLEGNRKSMKVNGLLMMASFIVAWGGLVLGAIAAVIILATG